jgi:hypothetical protein
MVGVPPKPSARLPGMGRSGTPLRRGYSSAAALESRRESLDNPCVVARNESGRRVEHARLSATAHGGPGPMSRSFTCVRGRAFPATSPDQAAADRSTPAAGPETATPAEPCPRRIDTRRIKRMEIHAQRRIPDVAPNPLVVGCCPQVDVSGARAIGPRSPGDHVRAQIPRSRASRLRARVTSPGSVFASSPPAPDAAQSRRHGRV